MKFNDVKVGAYFKFLSDNNTVQKTSPFGFTDPKNMVFGEQQIHMNPEVLPATTEKTEQE